MNNPAEQLIEDLRGRGVSLYAEGDRLKWRAPAGAVTDEALARLRACKPELLRLLSISDTASDTEKAVEDTASSTVGSDSELTQRRALYAYARRRGFPAVELPYHRVSVSAGEEWWRDFAQRERQYALWEAALRLDDVAEVAA